MGNLTIGEHTYGTVTRRGDMNNITIGKFCSIAIGVVVDSGFNHNSEWISTYPFNSNKGWPVPHNAICKGDINIGNDVWICENVLIMSGVTIGDGAIIGANSIVTKDVEPYTIVAGSPTKKIKSRFPWLIELELDKIKWWDWPIEHIEKAATFLMSGEIEGLINYYNQNVK
jgi:acetyltransferase-like isoleucine patch superfamily enzyme